MSMHPHLWIRQQSIQQCFVHSVKRKSAHHCASTDTHASLHDKGTWLIVSEAVTGYESGSRTVVDGFADRDFRQGSEVDFQSTEKVGLVGGV